MYLFIVFIPLLNLVFGCLFGRFLGKFVLARLFLINMGLCLFTAFLVFYEVGYYKYTCFIDFGLWMQAGLFELNWVFLFDNITVVMLLLVCFISFCVHVYSLDYMGVDPHLVRFLSYLSLFTFFMIFLVTAGTFVQLFFGWEGVGLSSYLLINFWYTRTQANKSAMKAIIVNRFGDFGIYFSLLLVYYYFKSFDFSVIFTLAPFLANYNVNLFEISVNALDFICFFIFLGAIGKSAQIGLHTWLPDAMEGPTPVSALIHAATMVTAGVFTLIRFSPLLEYSSSVLFLILLFGGLTAFFAGTVGLVQYDIKKVIAYSTCSQLGYMFFSCGISNYSVSLFHLFNHGFFKALLFLGAGSVIHALFDEQDMRKMGGLVKLLPVTYIAILIGSLSLLGFPFLTGFYSKDVILEVVYAKFAFSSFFVYWLGTVSAFITSFYSLRLIYYVFFSKTNSFLFYLKNSQESVSYITYILIILSFFSIFIGFLFKDLFVGLGSDFWSNSIFFLYSNTNILIAEFLPFYIKMTPVFFSLCGLIFSLLFYNYFFLSSLHFFTNIGLNNIYWFLSKKWYFDVVYNNFFVYKIFYVCYHITFKLLDRGWVEYFGPLGIIRVLKQFSFTFSFLQSGLLYNYIFLMILGSIIFLKFIFFSAESLNWNLVIPLTVILIFLVFQREEKRF
jgi:proton-translocating NADH-quinone oxidoreductase chain L